MNIIAGPIVLPLTLADFLGADPVVLAAVFVSGLLVGWLLPWAVMGRW